MCIRDRILDGIMYSFDEANMTYTATPAAENADPSTTYNYTNIPVSYTHLKGVSLTSMPKWQRSRKWRIRPMKPGFGTTQPKPRS